MHNTDQHFRNHCNKMLLTIYSSTRNDFKTHVNKMQPRSPYLVLRTISTILYMFSTSQNNNSRCWPFHNTMFKNNWFFQRLHAWITYFFFDFNRFFTCVDLILHEAILKWLNFRYHQLNEDKTFLLIIKSPHCHTIEKWNDFFLVHITYLISKTWMFF